MKHTIYLIAILLTALGMFVFLNFFPRSTVSSLERRELKAFPTFSMEALRSGEYTTSVSSWYSDTEPYRDYWMAMSMDLKKARALQIAPAEEQIAFIAGDEMPDAELAEDFEMISENDGAAGAADSGSYGAAVENSSNPTAVASETQTADEAEAANGNMAANAAAANGKITNQGIIIVGAAPTARALMMYFGKNGGEQYAKVVNTYQEKFTDVQVYCMIVPTAVEFYCPEKVKSRVQSEEATIENLYAHLMPEVKPIRLIPELKQHREEAIYLRTHHWSPLGAYYAARELCKVADVHVPDLSEFDERVTHSFVGTMYGFTQDVSIKRSPEDFVYYEPKNVEYTTTYTNYSIDENYRVTAEHKPYTGKFFFHYRDGSGAAYSTFMGGDCKITRVVTSTKNGRKVLILKDSFGNALPGYLFGSFEEIHVIDGRYFTKNMVAYVSQYGITDIVFANNVFKAYQGGRQYLKFLTQSGAVTYTPRPEETIAQPDSLHKTNFQDSLSTTADLQKDSLQKSHYTLHVSATLEEEQRHADYTNDSTNHLEESNLSLEKQVTGVEN